jgi:hypothetical protein
VRFLWRGEGPRRWSLRRPVPDGPIVSDPAAAGFVHNAVSSAFVGHRILRSTCLGRLDVVGMPLAPVSFEEYVRNHPDSIDPAHGTNHRRWQNPAFARGVLC